MKKRLFVFFYICWISLIFADDIFTNGEVSFYYQESEKAISYLRGDAGYPIGISRVYFYWITEQGELINLQENMVEMKKQGNAILELQYKNEDLQGNIKILPSFREKGQCYFFLNFDVKRKGLLFVEIIPQKRSDYVQKKEKGFEYHNFFVSSNRADFEILLSRDSSLQSFELQPLYARLKKHNRDHLYYLFPNFMPGKQEGILKVDFYQEENRDWKSFAETWQEEAGTIQLQESRYLQKSSSPIVQKNMEYLDLLSLQIKIPDKISYAKSGQSYLTKQQMLLLRSLYGFSGNENRILESVNLRKTEIESLEYFLYAFLYAEKNGKKIDDKLMEERLLPQILSMYDGMAEDGRIFAAEDALSVYARYDMLLRLLLQREEFQSEKAFLSERKQLLEEYIHKSFLSGDEWKNRSYFNKSNPKNIEYVFLLDEEKQKKAIENWYRKYHHTKKGVILYPKEEKLDMIHNLKMVSILYFFGMKTEATDLLSSLEQYIQQSQGYVLEKYSLTGKENPLEISSKGIYYYLMANLDREQSYGNERGIGKYSVSWWR